MGEYRKIVLAALERAASSFDEGELAYLALTSKPELLIRDRLAWQLVRVLDDRHVVSREWRRVDLAVLDHDRPVLLLEAKAFYAFDVVDPVGAAGWARIMKDDIEKTAAKYAEDGTELYALGLVTHLTGSIPDHLRDYVIKYARAHELRLTRHAPDRPEFNQSAVESMSEALGAWGAPCETVTFPGGEAWGIAAEVQATLIGPC